MPTIWPTTNGTTRLSAGTRSWTLTENVPLDVTDLEFAIIQEAFLRGPVPPVQAGIAPTLPTLKTASDSAVLSESRSVTQGTNPAAADTQTLAETSALAPTIAARTDAQTLSESASVNTGSGGAQPLNATDSLNANDVLVAAGR